MKRRWHCKPGEQPTEFDKRIMYLENKGALVPTRELIKTPEQIDGIRRAGVVNTGVLDAVGEAIHAGMSTLEIDKICRDCGITDRRFCDRMKRIYAEKPAGSMRRAG
jgi:methionyl aminopeptidase